MQPPFASTNLQQQNVSGDGSLSQPLNNIFTFNLFQPKVFPIACTACRLSHRKCSKTLPICDQCSSRGIQCVYQDRKKRAPKRGDGTNEHDATEHTSPLHDRDSPNSSSPELFRQQIVSCTQQHLSTFLSPSSTENTLHRLHDRVNFFASVFFDHLSAVTYPSFISKEKLLRLLLIDQQQELQIPPHFALQQSLQQNHVSTTPPNTLLRSEHSLVSSVQALCLQAAGYKLESQEKFAKAEDIVNDFWFNVLCGHSNDASLAVDAENIMCCMAIMSLYFAGSGLGEKSLLYQDMYKSLLDAHKRYFANNPDVKKLNPDFWEGILFFDRIGLLVNYSKVDYVNKVKLYKQLKITIFQLSEEQLRLASAKEVKPPEPFSNGKLELMTFSPDKVADVECFDVAMQVPFDHQSYISEQTAMKAIRIVDQAISDMFMSFNQVLLYGQFSQNDVKSSEIIRFAGVIYFYSLKVQAFWIMRQKVITLLPQYHSVLLFLRKLIIQNAGDIASMCRLSKYLGMTPYQTTTELKISFEILLQEFDYSRAQKDGLIDCTQMDTWLGCLLYGFEVFAHRYDSTLLDFGNFIRHLQQCKRNLANPSLI